MERRTLSGWLVVVVFLVLFAALAIHGPTTSHILKKETSFPKGEGQITFVSRQATVESNVVPISLTCQKRSCRGIIVIESRLVRSYDDVSPYATPHQATIFASANLDIPASNKIQTLTLLLNRAGEEAFAVPQSIQAKAVIILGNGDTSTTENITVTKSLSIPA